MPLPQKGNGWPPEEWRPVLDIQNEWAAWYSGDPAQLASVYSRRVFTPTPRGRFWAQQVKEERRLMLHVPLAGDLAAASADLLFSEPPRLVIPEAHGVRARSDAVTTQDRLLELAEETNLHNKLLEAAELCAGVGGVFLRVVFDPAVVDRPVLAPVAGDMALPEFRWGELVAVTFWRVVENDGQEVWRHLERHELIQKDGKLRGVVENGLYVGTWDKLGRKVDLGAHPATKGLAERVELPPGVGLAVSYVPNMRPARRMRHLPAGAHLGQADIAGAEGLLDALDEAYTSWIRDIRLAKSRILMPVEYLERVRGKDGEQDRWVADLDQEVFVGLDMAPTDQGGITLNQFNIRTQEHEQAVLHLIERIVSHAGYSPQTFGLRIEGRAESGTALRIRERRSFVTQARKQRYWRRPLEEILRVMLALDREIFGRPNIGVDYRPRVEFEDSIAPSMAELAETAQKLALAKAASTETLVRLIHPDWSDEQVQAEVQKIMAEQGLPLPNPAPEVDLP